MSVVTKVPHTDASVLKQNSAGDNISGASGSWTNVSATGAFGGTYARATVVGDKIIIRWNGRSLYGVIGQDNLGCDFTITTDGVTRPFRNTCAGQIDASLNADLSAAGTGLFKILMPLERGLSEGAHTTIIQSVNTNSTNTWGGSSFANLYFNGYVSVSGTKTMGNPNVLHTFGDSWTAAFGAYTKEGGYTNILQRMLAHGLQNPLITLTNNGQAGSSQVTKPTSTYNTGWEYLVNSGNAGANAPGYMTWLFGVNDMRTGGAACTGGKFLEFLTYTLMFIEDVFDVNTIKFALGTPGFIPPIYTPIQIMYAGGASNNQNIATQTGWAAYETALSGIRQIQQMFPWVLVADVFAAMDRRAELLMPNTASDLGLHPSPDCHFLIAETFANTLLYN